MGGEKTQYDRDKGRLILVKGGEGGIEMRISTMRRGWCKMNKTRAGEGVKWKMRGGETIGGGVCGGNSSLFLQTLDNLIPANHFPVFLLSSYYM
jgi:hypothetical protein